MANFDLNPTRFLPQGFLIIDGRPGRSQRIYAHLSGPVRRRHEEYAIAVVDVQLEPQQLNAVLHEIRNDVQYEAPIAVQSFSRHPHGLKLFQQSSPMHRDLLMAANPHIIGNILVCFIRHDHEINHKDSSYGKREWIVLLGFPLDYIETRNLEEAVSRIWENAPVARSCA